MSSIGGDSGSGTDSDSDDDSQIEEVRGKMQGPATAAAGMESINVELTPFEKQNALLTHVILPRFLPQYQPLQTYYHTELKLFDEMYENVMDLSGIIPSETVALFKSMHNVHHNLTSTNIYNEINALQPGDTFAMFVRRQRCTFMIYVPTDDENLVYGKPQTAIVATFPARMHPDEIYKCDSDLEVIFIVYQVFSKSVQESHS